MTRIRVEQTRGFTLVPALCENITEHTLGTGEPRNVTRGSALAAQFGRGIPHNTPVGIRGRREEPAPRPVVAPPSSGAAGAMPEGQPVVHVGFADPHPFVAPILSEDHDVRHALMVAGEST